MAGSGRTSVSRSRGDAAEQRAAEFLCKQGLRILCRNFHCRHGEIDIVAKDGQCLVFVEVRYRSRHRFGGAGHSVDGRKQGKIVRAASMYLARHPATADYPVRFDVIAIDSVHESETAQGRLQWTADAFRL